MSPIDYRGDFVYGEFHEAYDYARFQNYIVETANLCRQKKCHKLLIDIRAVTGKINTWDRFRLAESVLRYYGWDIQLVVVYRAEELNGFVENVIVNRGGNIQVFGDPALAYQALGLEDRAGVVK